MKEKCCSEKTEMLFRLLIPFVSRKSADNCATVCVFLTENISSYDASSKAENKNSPFSRILTLTEWDKDAEANETRNVNFYCYNSAVSYSIPIYLFFFFFISF